MIGRKFNCVCGNECEVSPELTICSMCKHWWNLEEISSWLKFDDKVEKTLLYGFTKEA